MKPILWLGIVGLVVQVCGCATKQKFSTEDAHYAIIWSGNNVKKIECWSDKLPQGFLFVDISRDDDCKKVLINNKRYRVWSKDVFTRSADTGSCSGIVFHGESSWLNSDRLE